MSGRLVGLAILAAAVIAGAALYYLQVYGYYEELAPEEIPAVTLLAPDGTSVPLPARDLSAIDAGSSPIRYRACFRTEARPEELAARFVEIPGVVPRNAPGWFDCFDAAAIGAMLDSGEARAFVSEKNVHYGVDRIVAVARDGRGFVWHELNDCGQKAYDGTVVGEECPRPPARQ